MVYRKTEAVLASLEAKRQGIIDSTIAIIARYGVEAVTVDLVAERAKGSVGMLYKYFPDKTEIIAAAVDLLLQRDLEAMRAAEAEASGADAMRYISALMVFYTRMEKPRLVRALFETPAYREAVRDEIARIIPYVSDMKPKERGMAANAVLGVLYGVFQASGSGVVSARSAVLFALRCVGLSDGVARRSLDRYSLQE